MILQVSTRCRATDNPGVRSDPSYPATDNLLNGSVSGFYSASSNQEAADLCASAATDRGFTSFDIVFVSAFQQYQCSGGIKSYTAATCDENNAAIYFTS